MYIIGFPDNAAWKDSFNGMSDACHDLFKTFSSYLTYRSNNIAFTILNQIGNILPIALSVAGAILVVKLGWKLFKNFTKG